MYTSGGLSATPPARGAQTGDRAPRRDRRESAGGRAARPRAPHAVAARLGGGERRRPATPRAGGELGHAETPRTRALPASPDVRGAGRQGTECLLRLRLRER